MSAKLSEEPFSSDDKERLLVLATEMELALENIAMGTSLRVQAQRFKIARPSPDRYTGIGAKAAGPGPP